MTWPRVTARFSTAIAAGLRRSSPLHPLARTPCISTPPRPPLTPPPGSRLLFCWPSRAAMVPLKSPPATATVALAAAREGASSGSSSHHDPGRCTSRLELTLLLTAAAGAAVAAAATPRTAHAASGGVMGGRSSSSPSSYCSSSPSRSSYYSSSSSSSSSSPPPRQEEEGVSAIQVIVAAAAAAVYGMARGMAYVASGVAYVASGVVYVVAHLIRPRSATTVIKLQVAFRGLTKIIQRDLNGIARKVDTSNRSWDKFMLTETICSLNRHKDICISSSLSADLQKRLLFWGDCWEKHFDKISIEERSKFDEETLYNVQGIKMKKKYLKTPGLGKENEYLVLTILLAAEGKLEFPIVRSASDLTTVLGILNSIHAKKIEGIQVSWTPQKIGDVLPEERLLKDYPYLKPLLKDSNSFGVASVTEGQDSLAVSSATEVKQSNQGSIMQGQEFVGIANVIDVKQSNQESTKEEQDSKHQDSIRVASAPDVKQSNQESTKEGQDSSGH